MNLIKTFDLFNQSKMIGTAYLIFDMVKINFMIPDLIIGLY